MIIDKLKEIGKIKNSQSRIFEVFQLADDKLFPVLGQISDRRAALRLLLKFIQEMPDNLLEEDGKGVFDALLGDITEAYREIIEALPEKERAEFPKRIG